MLITFVKDGTYPGQRIAAPEPLLFQQITKSARIVDRPPEGSVPPQLERGEGTTEMTRLEDLTRRCAIKESFPMTSSLSST